LRIARNICGMICDRQVANNDRAPGRSFAGGLQIGIFLSKQDLARTEGAEDVVSRSPVPTRVVSNGEFTPIPQTEQQKRVEARIQELADSYGAR
jgi:hypothetical protein